MTCYPHGIFHVKIQLFVTAMSNQDPDPHRSALVWFTRSGSALRLKAGSESGSAFKPMRTRNTAGDNKFLKKQIRRCSICSTYCAYWYNFKNCFKYAVWFLLVYYSVFINGTGTSFNMLRSAHTRLFTFFKYEYMVSM
jgi:hypothetical protein